MQCMASLFYLIYVYKYFVHLVSTVLREIAKAARATIRPPHVYDCQFDKQQIVFSIAINILLGEFTSTIITDRQVDKSHFTFISHTYQNLNKNPLKREKKRLKTCSIQVVKHAIRRLEFIDFSYNLCWFFFSLANSKTTITFKRQKKISDTSIWSGTPKKKQIRNSILVFTWEEFKLHNSFLYMHGANISGFCCARRV